MLGQLCSLNLIRLFPEESTFNPIGNSITIIFVVHLMNKGMLLVTSQQIPLPHTLGCSDFHMDLSSEMPSLIQHARLQIRSYNGLANAYVGRFIGIIEEYDARDGILNHRE